MLTVSAAAGLSGLCAGYVSITRPLLQPTEGIDQRPFASNAVPLIAPENDLAARYLPDQPWAANAEYVVRNGRSVLFFNSFTPVEQGSAIQLQPFAMVFPPKLSEQDAEPVVILGDEAIVRVSGTIEDLTTAEPGRIIGGAVPGRVKLRGPDGLELDGRDFIFDEHSQRLWSDQPVAFRQGPHRGRGRGLQLELFRVGPPEAFESVAVSGVTAIRLLRDVEMELRLDGAQGGPMGGLGGVSGVAEGTSEREVVPTLVTSTGPFTFNLETNEAVFEEHVVAKRLTEGTSPDSIECDILAIVFEPATEEAKQRAAERRAKKAAGTLTEADGFQSIDDDLEVKWLVARGVSRPAVLRSPSNEFVATVDRLVYVAETGITTLARDHGVVEARQGASVLDSPEIQIEPQSEGGPPVIVCKGAGRMRHYDPPDQLAMTARWSESLRRMRMPGGLDLIRLMGQARVEQPQEEFVLAGSRIDLWLDPKESHRPSNNQRALSDSNRMEPVRLIAEGNVMLRSPEMNADAKLLDVTFTDPLPDEPVAARVARERLTATSTRSAAGVDLPRETQIAPPSPGNRGPSWQNREIITLASAEQTAPPAAPPPEPPPFVPPASPPPAATPEVSGDADKTSGANRPANAQATPPVTGQVRHTETTEPSKPAPEPIELIAEVIKVLADRPQRERSEEPSAARRGGQVREVHTAGGVVVRQKRAEGEPPMRIQGDRLDLFHRGEGRELVHIYGKSAELGPEGKVARQAEPAWVHDQGADLYGLNVNLDRAENRAWVDGEGVLQLPAKGATGLLRLDDRPRESADENTGSEEAEDQRLTVWWTEKMEFDGNQATFYGGVQTEMASDRMFCEEMIVRLTERFDFANAGRRETARPSSQPEVAEVICRQGVRVDGAEMEGERVIAVRRAAFYEFRLDQRTGDTRAFGPGQIEMWRRGEGNRAALAADNSVRANATIERETKPWEYVLVRFVGTSEGNIRHRTTVFHRDVRVVYGPVADPQHTIDPNRPDQAPAEAGWMTCKRLTLTQHRPADGAKPYSEVLGEDNVKLAGRGFQGEADQVAYDESKGQYVLKSFGRRVATVAMNDASGRGSGGGSGQQITFYPARGAIHVDRAAGFEGIQ